jgi:hypothetical protein
MWRGDEKQVANYPYVKTAEDIAAFNRYAKSGFFPPERPDGFLDDQERAIWEGWLDKLRRQNGRPYNACTGGRYTVGNR